MKELIHYIKWVIKVLAFSNILIIPGVFIANLLGHCIKFGVPDTIVQQTCADYGGPLTNILIINSSLILILIIEKFFGFLRD